MAVDKGFGLGVLTFTTELVYDIFFYIERPKVWGCFSTPNTHLSAALHSYRMAS